MKNCTSKSKPKKESKEKKTKDFTNAQYKNKKIANCLVLKPKFDMNGNLMLNNTIKTSQNKSLKKKLTIGIVLKSFKIFANLIFSINSNKVMFR